MTGTYGAADDAETLRAVANDLDAGIMMFDTADILGPYTSEILFERLFGEDPPLSPQDLLVLNEDGAVVAPDSCHTKIGRLSRAASIGWTTGDRSPPEAMRTVARSDQMGGVSP